MSKKDWGRRMKVVQICIGSACHLKGSYEVLGIFKSLIKTYNLEDKLVLKAAFCTGNCTQAVSVMKWDGTLLSLNKENAEAVFLSDILPYL